MNLTQWEFVFPLSLDELSRDVATVISHFDRSWEYYGW